MSKLVSWFRSGLGRFHFFRRKAEADTEESAPTVLPDTVAETQPSADVVAEQAEAQPAGLWSRLAARFRKREAVDAGPADVAAEAPLAAAEGEVEQPAGFWSRLAARFSKRGAAVADVPEQEVGAGKPGRRVAGATREALPSDGEGEAEQPAGFWSRLVARLHKRKAADADESAAEALRPDAGRGKGGAQARDDREAGKRSVHGADELEEEPPAPRGIKGFLARKPVWISLIVLAFGATLFGGWFAAQEWQARGVAAAKALAQRNQALAGQNKKLQAENARLAKEKSKLSQPAQGGGDSAEQGAGGAPSSSADEDCTVGDKASVRDALKGCIDSFNAASGR
jgi:hypothetical protein